MFTGIIEAVGDVLSLTPTSDGYRLTIRTALARELKDGDSLAVNGVCLTAVRAADDDMDADIGPETARVTTLSRLAAGDVVNLERPLRLGGRLDGHLVQGHVDGIGTVHALREEAGSYWLGVRFPRELARLFVHKGSVAVDGVSLTVAALHDGRFDVQLIPYTWLHTTFSRRRVGDAVNLECDMIGKYVLRAVEAAHGGRGTTP